ncbi:MAG: ISNCY family transposase [Chloroflexi bacterium]|nr:ISNCY family transposase [Chloroflexota bacterium]
MSAKEARRVYVVEQVVMGTVTAGEAARVLGLSIRQVKRLKGGLLGEGVASLAHKNRGRKPSNALEEPLRQRILELALGPYLGASCQQMSELLSEYHQIHLSAKSITRILKTAGIPLRYGHKSARRRRSRDRMPQAGLLVQCDSSPYQWLEDRGPYLHLHGAIDDATGQILGLYFSLQEEILGYFHVLSQVLLNHGVPRSLYSDRHTIFFSPKADKLTVEHELAGVQKPLTQFGRALRDLGVRHIPARSPQAKGRVERLWGTLQGRLLIEMRLAGISSLEQANAFLPAFIVRFNQRFSVEPADPASAFQPVPSSDFLNRTLALHTHRSASPGSTISCDHSTYQLINPQGDVQPLKPKARVTVLTHLDGSISALYQDKHHTLRLMPAQPKPESHTNHTKPTGSRRVHTWKPSENHPWKTFNRPKYPPPGPVERLIEAQLKRDFWDEVFHQR